MPLQPRQCSRVMCDSHGVQQHVGFRIGHTFSLAATWVAAYTTASATNGSQFVNIVSTRMDGGLAGASALACSARWGGTVSGIQDQLFALIDE